MKKFQCPNCNANLSFEDDREFAFCQYCGTKIILDDYRSTHRIVDEARIKEAETERVIRLKELEIEERDLNKGRKGRTIAYCVALAFVLLGCISTMIGSDNSIGMIGFVAGMWIALVTYLNGDEQKKKAAERRNARNGMIKLVREATECERKDYRSVEAAFTALGFRNIELVNLHDLRAGIMKKPGSVEFVRIDGETPVADKWYHPTARVTITYHDYR